MNVFALRARYTARPKDPILEREGYFQKTKLGDTEQLTDFKVPVRNIALFCVCVCGGFL